MATLVNGLLVTGNYFSTMRATVALGRPILPDDDRPGAEPVAVISYGFWQRVYGGSSDVLDRFTTLRGLKFRIADGNIAAAHHPWCNGRGDAADCLRERRRRAHRPLEALRDE